jgi:hypothetical protein
MNGIVEVDVVGTAQASIGGTSVPAVHVSTQASGYLNGTIEGPGNVTIQVTGSFAADTSELWEDQAYLPVESNSSSSYVIDVKFIVTTQVSADLWLNATTTYASIPAFNLTEGDMATALSITSLDATSSVTFFGNAQRVTNRTSFASVWSRAVVGEGNVTVEAGTFSACRLNESLGNFPGFTGAVPVTGANETAWFSNDVGYYVERTAYVNGTPVAEMRLKSYTYPAAAPGIPLLEWTFVLGVPAAALIAILLIVVARRRRRAARAPEIPKPFVPMPDLPPETPRGKP